MERAQLEFSEGFNVLVDNGRAQAAVMTLAAGTSIGGPENQHEGSDQWLYVVAGSGTAIVAGEEHELETGTLLLIERGETHEIRNTDDRPLETLNVYVPPAY
ncbi:MAG: cupin domain-containing protein [Gemmatimonadetes bacterium]|uniref:Cupin domain-containing protein n=1 Tax=Candidatus Kutchimonas denitrificans TaxID=3056748 RepID=A0AAE4Z914_9BACT|nr:cupin domain-containing protein [Gemmatimonadota bacterium]NIR74862.1 cupin domain-containing protein [Candidatus Kutchimonas denitrificans]NIR99973.1 cupin domain-containing protein [Gemmatimonadota bacterium]NIT65557.1 cupin domain-containing protein [Gemmatimonadota bacterium]NIU52527.1 cupin domain-containing protein [Gemmatimonadota bacterium]